MSHPCVCACTIGEVGGGLGLFCEEGEVTQIRRFNALMDLQGVVVAV